MKIMFKSKLSKKILGHPQLEQYNKKLKELKEIAEKISPDGLLSVSLLDKSDKFNPINKLIRDLSDLEYLYSYRALQSKPELGHDFMKISSSIKDILAIIKVRRKSMNTTSKKKDNNENLPKNNN
jgi:hypothetical protein